MILWQSKRYLQRTNMPLTEDHLLLLKKQSSGTEYRQILAELRHRGIDAEKQRNMFNEIADAIREDVETPSESTISKLLGKRRK